MGIFIFYFLYLGIKLVIFISIEIGGIDLVSDFIELIVLVEDYYCIVVEKIGNSLKIEFYNIIDYYIELLYLVVWEVLKKMDEDLVNVNNVILFYIGCLQVKSINGGGVDDWNCEYVWVKFYGDFGIVMGFGIDFYYLCLIDVFVNSMRGNLDFDNGGMEYSEVFGNYFDSDLWEF